MSQLQFTIASFLTIWWRCYSVVTYVNFACFTWAWHWCAYNAVTCRQASTGVCKCVYRVTTDGSTQSWCVCSHEWIRHWTTDFVCWTTWASTLYYLYPHIFISFYTFLSITFSLVLLTMSPVLMCRYETTHSLILHYLLFCFYWSESLTSLSAQFC